MRISDWSSDVCSSDLTADQTAGTPSADSIVTFTPAALPLFHDWNTDAHAAALLSETAGFSIDRLSARRNSIPNSFMPTPARNRDRPKGMRTPVQARSAQRRTPSSMRPRSEEHTSELQSLMRISYAVFCLKKKITHKTLLPPPNAYHHSPLK